MALTLSPTLSRNLQGLWLFDNNYFDLSPNKYHLSPSGSPTFVSTPKGQGLNVVSASSQYAFVDSAANLNITGDRTMAAWVKPTIFTHDAQIMTKGADTHHLYIQAGDGKTVLNLTGLTTNAFVISTAVSTVGNFYFIVGRYDSAAGKISVTHFTASGTRTYTEAVASGSATSETGQFRFGYDGTSFSDEVVDFGAIWSRALSDAEITDLFNNFTNYYAYTKGRRTSTV